LAPLVYEKNPDSWTNFDSEPMVKRPTIAKTATLADNRLTGWFGFTRDRPIIETWKGSDSESSIMLTFLRGLYAYYENPPSTGYITWAPKDRTADVYNIVINSVTLGGTDIKFDYLAALQNCGLGDLTFTFTIVSKV